MSASELCVCGWAEDELEAKAQALQSAMTNLSEVQAKCTALEELLEAAAGEERDGAGGSERERMDQELLL